MSSETPSTVNSHSREAWSLAWRETREATKDDTGLMWGAIGSLVNGVAGALLQRSWNGFFQGAIGTLITLSVIFLSLLIVKRLGAKSRVLQAHLENAKSRCLELEQKIVDLESTINDLTGSTIHLQMQHGQEVRVDPNDHTLRCFAIVNAPSDNALRLFPYTFMGEGGLRELETGQFMKVSVINDSPHTLTNIRISLRIFPFVRPNSDESEPSGDFPVNIGRIPSEGNWDMHILNHTVYGVHIGFESAGTGKRGSVSIPIYVEGSGNLKILDPFKPDLTYY
ncbi:MAG: hypothetical protein EON58_01960 [Alphaproteobacteria bacterium]|nr:MAG: hypothetical protein EON58_01960 [Alphaproteobacteria bacterium]